MFPLKNQGSGTLYSSLFGGFPAPGDIHFMISDRPCAAWIQGEGLPERGASWGSEDVLAGGTVRKG